MDSRKRTVIARTVACLMIRAEYARICSGESFLDKHPLHIPIPPEAIAITAWSDMQAFVDLALVNGTAVEFEKRVWGTTPNVRCGQFTGILSETVTVTRKPLTWKEIIDAYQAGFDSL